MKSVALTLAIASSAIGVAHAVDSAAILTQRIDDAIARTRAYKVVLEDVLGEGPGHWDSDPRYPTGTVNCMVWLQLILSEAYGAGLADKTPVMDRIRYYGGRVAFSMRKHYTDQWMDFDPEPLRRVNLSACAFPYYRRVQLEPGLFLKSRKFSCSLYQIERNAFDVEYVKGSGLLKCALTLRSAYYVVFGVPSAGYVQKHLQETGPMGQVHALLLKVTGEAGASEALIHHASTQAGQVLSEKLEAFVERMKNTYEGYAVYALDPSWDYRRPAKPHLVQTQEIQRLLECERGLPADSGNAARP